MGANEMRPLFPGNWRAREPHATLARPMRFFRTLPVAAAATLAFAVVVPASCSSTEGVPSAVALDASIDEMFGTKAAALTADTIVGNGLHITLTDAGRLQVVDLASAEMSRSDTGIPRAAIGLSVGSTLCHASLDDTEAGTPGIQNGIVAGVAGAGTDALPYKLVLTGTCAAVPVAITITYRPRFASWRRSSRTFRAERRRPRTLRYFQTTRSLRARARRRATRPSSTPGLFGTVRTSGPRPTCPRSLRAVRVSPPGPTRRPTPWRSRPSGTSAWRRARPL